MPLLSSLTAAGTWHLLSWGTLLGSQFFQSFIGGPVAFRALPRPMFAQLQAKIFPVYFSLQSALPLVVLLTHPSTTKSYSELLLGTEAAIPMLVTLVTSAINLGVVGPKTTKIMRARKVQETRDGRKYYEEPVSEEMRFLNKRFGVVHGVSSLLNLVGLLSTAAYGIVLGSKLGV
ncbi:hypothetical protein FN846DRAFT_900005 [Sphaerosporella brunnea]|uniref:TMEM205-like domain-containing protein n=1 Tax=Sphaerosporella brunnea TaxID=1250544 RepID=A0A5J5EPT6_9PEZI|nr:hypothetical protein FN846DRAFT_900005 [Sphaerosporella brunnea]